MVGLTQICLDLVTKSLPEAADWERYFNILIEFFSNSLKQQKDFEVFFSGSHGEGGKFYRADDVGDVDIMVTSLNNVRHSCELEDITNFPGFVKIKLPVNTQDETTYYESKNLKVGSFFDLSERIQSILTLMASSFNSYEDIKVIFHPKPGGAAYGFTIYSKSAQPSKFIKEANQINPLSKSVISDLARATCIGFGKEDKVAFIEPALNNLCSIVEEKSNEPPLDVLEEIFHTALGQTGSEKNTKLEKEVQNILPINAESSESEYHSSKNLAGTHAIEPEIKDPPMNKTESEELSSEYDGQSTKQKTVPLELPLTLVTPTVQMSEITLDDEQNPPSDTHQQHGKMEKSDHLSSKRNTTPDLSPDTKPDLSPHHQQFFSTTSTNTETFADNLITKHMFQHSANKSGQRLTEKIPEDTHDQSEVHVSLFDSSNANGTEGEVSRESGIDIVPAIKCVGWPNVAAEWYTRERKWPLKEKVDEIVSCGFHVVAKQPKAIDQRIQDHTFRLSFSMPEKILCNAMNEVQLCTYRVLKALHHEEFKPISNHFSSYHIKTLMFWACENNNNWTDLGDAVSLVLFNLYEALGRRQIEHYFIRQCNLLSDFDDKEIERMTSHVLLILSSPEDSFRKLVSKIEQDARKISEVVEQQKKIKAEPVTIPPALHHQTFQQLWSKQYDEVTEELILTLESGIGPEDLSENFLYAAETIGVFVEEGKMSLASVKKVLFKIKELAYLRHMMNLNDMQNENVRGIVLSDMRIITNFIKDIASRPAEEIESSLSSQESMNRLMASLFNSSDEDGFNMEAFMPDLNSVIDCLQKTI